MTSHEIRNPLSAILHSADEIITTLTEHASSNLKKETLDATIEAAQTIAYCVQHQKRIVDDVLTLSKLDSDLLSISPIAVQPIEMVQDALKVFEGEMKSADIEMQFREEPSMKEHRIEWVLLDPSRVIQVLLNLFTNAIKFTRSEGLRRITVGIKASLSKPPAVDVDYVPLRKRRRELDPFLDDDAAGQLVYLSLSVEDTGRGLSPKERELLFSRFSQASPKTHTQYGGSGLGLFISRQLTEMQGGEIGIASEAGKGSRFEFFVKTRRTAAPAGTPPPVNQPTRLQLEDLAESAKDDMETMQSKFANASLQAPLPPRTPTLNLNILLVEDNLVNQKVLCKQLRKRGCVVDTADHGLQALDILQERYNQEIDSQSNKMYYSVILMDIEMPYMDGLTCVRKIRELEKTGYMAGIGRFPIIAVTANARKEQVEAALAAGIDDVTTKPYRIEEIVAQIRKLVD